MLRALPCAVLLLTTLTAHAQRHPDPRSDPDPRRQPQATVIRPTPLYLEADTGSDKLSTIAPGREMAILERSGHWLRVYANTDEEAIRQDQPVFTDQAPNHPISGWMQDGTVVAGDTANGEAILFGEAISAEQAASEPHAAAGAALDARRLYRMSAELFPQGPRAGEALWRSADIRWQLQKQDAATLPSAHEKENYLRQLPDESEMKLIEKQFPGSKWASYAAYELIDNKLCGDWQGAEKCPEKEAGYYGEFADRYPDSPRAPQALYEAAWRLACAGDMWISDNDEKRSTDDRNRSVAAAAHLLEKYPATDYAARAAGLAYKVQHAIPIYGSDRQ